MNSLVLCALLALVLVGWVLYINANDRKTFEKQLEEVRADDPDA